MTSQALSLLVLPLLMFPLAPAVATAQQLSGPAPVLRVAVEPDHVVVGQATTLRIEVLAPNYMTKPPLLPDIQILNAVSRPASTVNTSEQRDGTTYAGVRYEFLVYPQEPGAYALDGKTVTLSYAADPPHTREAMLPLPRLAFEAFIPDPAQGLDPFVSASRLTLRQEVRPSSQPPKVGDAVVRTVTVEAEGTPAMLIPPTVFAASAGATLYPAPPQLQDRSDRRTDVLTSSRVDQGTYMLQAPGDLTLPGIELRWWNTREQKIETAHADPVVLQVIGSPSTAPPAAGPGEGGRALHRAVLFAIDHWPATLALLGALGLLAWRGPGLVRAVRAWAGRRAETYRVSEACAFADLKKAARRGGEREVYFALTRWLLRFDPVAPARTIGALEAAARDPQLDQEIARIERHLFSGGGGDADWSARALLKRLARARRKLLHPPPDVAILPSTLNPSRSSGDRAYPVVG